MKRNSIAVLIMILSCMGITTVHAQDDDLQKKLERSLQGYFSRYKPKHTRTPYTTHLHKVIVDDAGKTMKILVDETFSMQEFTPSIVSDIYKKLQRTIPKEYAAYRLELITNGMGIEELIPNRLAYHPDKSRMWGSRKYSGRPWVECVSNPRRFTHGLYNRHISLWASHGRYYDAKKGIWKWQRPSMFGTTEDLFTQTIVVPYLIPMLENAGAVVFTPRERDWQKEEVIVDNDHSVMPFYKEEGREAWQTTSLPGFAQRQKTYQDKENPFKTGTARMARTVKGKPTQSISYQPYFNQGGSYAVYVSYQSVANSIDDAQYIVYHKGQTTEFRVNQQMGDGTWVYLGTFEFDKGSNAFNRVVLTNRSRKKGIVTADAVRFGGGMGNIVRGGTVSGLPRSLEGARYYAQWAGVPYDVYSTKQGTDDYSDDINVRSHFTNWLGGGSVFMPGIQGKHVPIELALALHSDAGYTKDFASLVGSLAICTTSKDNNHHLAAGISRMASRDFADALLDGVYRDIRYKYGYWNRRMILDRNYSESRLPEVPSAILEMLSHQNFPDMIYAQDPNFKFTLARSIYKTILRYISDQHGQEFAVEPLRPDHFAVEFTGKNKVRLSWKAVDDPQEPTSDPEAYRVYAAVGNSGFDNGTTVKDNHYTLRLEPGVPYHFKVTALNRGGESFPTETLSALFHPKAKRTVLIVNGFDRLSAPAVINNENQQGFDMDADIGVSYGKTAGWNGKQITFAKTQAGKEGPGSLGYGSEEFAGRFIAGNDFDYVKTHAQAISGSRCNIVSCSDEAIEADIVNLGRYDAVDFILGLEKQTPYAMKTYKTFSARMQQRLAQYLRRNGRLLVSGAYVASDMSAPDEKDFIGHILKIKAAGPETSGNDRINGMGTSFNIYRLPNEEHYATQSPDVVLPVSPAYCALLYPDGQSAAVAYAGKDYRCFTMGFPFECIVSRDVQSRIMKGILHFLLN